MHDEPAARDLAETAADIARQAGRLLMDRLPLGRFKGPVEHKAGRELVSECDRESEALIAARIGEAYPEHSILGEEGGQRPASEGARYRWIVDPLDGTTNFLHGHPFFAVSIGVERLPETLPPELWAAVVFAPCLGEMYVAARGMGAFLNTPAMPLAVADTSDVSDAMVATGFAYDRARFDNHANFARISEATRAVRRCGAAALDLAFVAAGRYDGFWELGLGPHDVAAGALLVQEAGGRVGEISGGDGWLHGRNIVAACPGLFEPLRALIDPAPR